MAEEEKFTEWAFEEAAQIDSDAEDWEVWGDYDYEPRQ